MAKMKSPEESAQLGRIVATLDARLDAMLPEALRRATAIRGTEQNIHKFHAFIGSRNTKFVDSVREKFDTPEHFFARWLHGLTEECKAAITKRLQWREKYGTPVANVAIFQLVRMVHDPQLREYILLFLERNFYRNLEARIRTKPAEVLWELWFGDNKAVWGLIITPEFRDGRWTNDVSQMRRANYDYWTVEHVLEEGFVNPVDHSRVRFASLAELTAFYQTTLMGRSKSFHERAIADRYVHYLERSPEQSREPFLIPELRYAGLEDLHRYRLDFTVFNVHTMRFIGVELSPHSTHGAVQNTDTKSPEDVNREVAATFTREMQKRNEYFGTFGLTTLTFTDEQLRDPDMCFRQMAIYLTERGQPRPSLAHELQVLEGLDLSEIGH
jgi:hypothetical protein